MTRWCDGTPRHRSCRCSVTPACPTVCLQRRRCKGRSCCCIACRPDPLRRATFKKLLRFWRRCVALVDRRCPAHRHDSPSHSSPLHAHTLVVTHSVVDTYARLTCVAVVISFALGLTTASVALPLPIVAPDKWLWRGVRRGCHRRAVCPPDCGRRCVRVFAVCGGRPSPGRVVRLGKPHASIVCLAAHVCLAYVPVTVCA